MAAFAQQPETVSLLTVKEAAARFRVSEKTIRRHGRVALRKFGSRTLVEVSVLSRILKIEFADNLVEPLEQSGRETTMLMLQRKRWARGSVYLRRGKRGAVWYGRWWEDSQTADGKLVRRYRKVRLGDSAEIPNRSKARNELQKLMNAKRDITVDMTFAELCDRWEKVNEPKLKPSTFASYRTTVGELRKRFICPIAAITRHICESYLLDKAKTHSRSIVRSHQCALSMVFEYAVVNDWLPKNPVRGIRLPRTFGGRRVKRAVLTPELVRRLVAELKETTATLVEFLYQTGLRISEARELRWSDLVDGVLHVRGTKSESADRKLPLPAALIERLQALPVDGELIFHGKGGSPINRRYWLLRDLHPAAERVGIKVGGWHDFRHGASRRLRMNGVHPKLVSAILGHSKVNLAMDCYDVATVDELRIPLRQLNPIEPKTQEAA